jgi:hypothetical protein
LAASKDLFKAHLRNREQSRRLEALHPRPGPPKPPLPMAPPPPERRKVVLEK